MLPCLLSVRAAVVLRGPRSVEMPAVAASSMTQIDGWTRGAVKRMAHRAVSRKWKWELADFWLIFLKLSNKLMN